MKYLFEKKNSFGKKINITGILYLYRIDRMMQPPLPHYQMFRGLCGEEFHARVLLVTTMWEGERRQAILKRHWSEMIAKGSAVVCHDGKWESAWEVVKTLVRMRVDPTIIHPTL